MGVCLIFSTLRTSSSKFGKDERIQTVSNSSLQTIKAPVKHLALPPCNFVSILI